MGAEAFGKSSFWIVDGCLKISFGDVESSYREGFRYSLRSSTPPARCTRPNEVRSG